MQALIDVILPVFLVLGLGYVSVWKGWFTDEFVETLLRFAQSVAIPLLLFRAVSRMDLSQDFDLPMLASFYTGAFSGFCVGALGARFIFGRPWPDSVAIGFVGLFSNSVLLGLPIAERAWGPEAMKPIFTIIAFHAPFCYAIGLTAMETVRNASGGWRMAIPQVLRAIFRNQLIQAILAGFAVNIAGISVPVALGDAMDLMATAGLPAALFGLGGTLYRYRPEGDMRVILYIVGVSLVVHPAVTWSMAKLLGVTGLSFRAAVLTSAMAPGVNAYLFANMYGVGRRVAASALLIATGLTMLTAWFWISILP